jgi:hypothetical protein
MMSIRLRKIILWSVVIVLGILLFFLWLKSCQLSMGRLESKDFFEKLNLPSIEMPELPSINLPEINYGEKATTSE